MKNHLPKKLQSSAYLKELLPLLVQKKYVGEASKKATNVGSSGFDRSWTVYFLTSIGERALSSLAPIILPVPDYFRAHERKEEEKRQQLLARLEKHGIAKEILPPEEVATGDGECVRAYNNWFSYLDRNSERVERHAQLSKLMTVIEQWRSEAAVRQSIAPASFS